MKIWWQADIQIYYQVAFSAHSIKRLATISKSNEISTFYYIQSLLAALANISKTLQKSEEYRAHLEVELTKIPNIMNRRIRNINEHMEDYLFNKENIATFTSDMAVGDYKADASDMGSIIRYFNEEEQSIQFVDKRGLLNCLLLREIETELAYLSGLEPIKYAFERYKESDLII